MEHTAQPRHRAVTVILWIGTVLVTLGLGLAGAAKFITAPRWDALFAGWGYPAWCSRLIGVAEMGGAIGLLVPKIAFYAAILLAAVMTGALVTLLTHLGGPLGWGATPTVYIVILSGIAAGRRKERARR
jgi:putative oxidoreductase